MLTATTYSKEKIVNHTFYKINLPQDAKAVVFYNGIKALNIRGFFWLWQQILFGKLNSVNEASGCVEVKLAICTPAEAIIVSYWQDEESLSAFFHSSLHRQMMKNMTSIVTGDREAISVFNETYRPLKSGKYLGKYLSEPQGLAKIYPTVIEKL